MWSVLVPLALLVGAYIIGVLHAKSRIQNNMMQDLVEAKDMAKWLRVWT